MEDKLVFCPQCGHPMTFEEIVDDEACYWCEVCGMDHQEPVEDE